MATLATESEMELAAQNWLTYCIAQRGEWAGTTQPQIAGYEDIIVDGQRLGRVFFVEPNGYVVVPVLKELPPVKFYSEEAWLDLDHQQGTVALYRDVLKDRSQRFIEFYGSLAAAQPSEEPQLFGQEHLQQWDQFAVNTRAFVDHLPALTSSPEESVGPLLTTNWHQSGPYNNLCPIGDGGGRCVVGCVATGLAQIMNYHQWPPQGSGGHYYMWNGDQSCGDAPIDTYPMTADFSDPYDWENMADDCADGCTSQENAALAELCFELGVLVDMDYGVCASGSFPQVAINRLPEHFNYKNTLARYNRGSAEDMFNKIRMELNADRPMLYVIYSHAIVCDGYRDGALQEVHMNYGWADNHNKWYVLDNLHCPWDGCSPIVEWALVGMQPDKKAVVSAENTVGWAPLDVQFYGFSDLMVDLWKWRFGDGDSATVQNPLHTYETPGVYDVTMMVNSGGTWHTATVEDMVVSIADTLWGENAVAPPGAPLEVVVCARNNVPLNEIRVPMELAGSLNLSGPDSISVSGCRTEGIAAAQYLHFDPFFNRYTCQIIADDPDGITPGSGPVLKVYFSVPGSADDGQQVSFDFDGYTDMGGSDYTPTFAGTLASYDAACNGCVATISSTLDVDEPGIDPLPGDYALGQNYPNPFNPSTRISFALPRAGHVRLTVFNILGEQVTTLVDRELTVGEHSTEWDGRNNEGQPVSSGTYLYRLEVDGQTKQTRKMLLLK